MITELCLTDFFEVISNGGAISDLELLRALFSQIVTAVAATHYSGLCHLDIKLENVLVAKDCSLRLCDYGFARPADKLIEVQVGTYGYMAPEVVRGERFDGKKSDIFNLGVLLFIIAFGRPPFSNA